jgi:hypothetical protein
MLKTLLIYLFLSMLICHLTNAHFHTMGLKPKWNSYIRTGRRNEDKPESSLFSKEKSWPISKRASWKMNELYKIGRLPEFSAKRAPFATHKDS